MPAIFITPARPDDVTAIATLLAEMDQFYGDNTPDPPEERAQQIEDALFSAPPAAYALLAWNKTHLAGLATYSFLWPAVGLTRSLYLKELYVTKHHRGQDTGRLLMQELFRIAEAHKCSRVEWTTDQDNPDAQAFYSRLGVSAHPTKIFYRIENNGSGFRSAR